MPLVFKSETDMDEFCRFSETQERLSRLFERSFLPSKESQLLLDAHEKARAAFTIPSGSVLESAWKMAEQMAPLLEKMKRVTDVAEFEFERTNVTQRLLADNMPEAPTVTMNKEPELFRPLPHLPLPQVQVSPAVEVLQFLRNELEDKKAEIEDTWHAVGLVVTMLDGTRLLVDCCRDKGGQLVVFQGQEITYMADKAVLRIADDDLLLGDQVEKSTGASTFQYEFVVVVRTPDLHLVD